MKILNTSVLNLGDIILTTTFAPVSKAIRLGTRSDISHAMFYVQDHSVIDATSDGVQSRNTQRLIMDDNCAVYVLRLRQGLSDSQTLAICEFVRQQIGTQYSLREAIQVGLGRRKQKTKKQFCSRLVAQAYASIGISLVDDPNFCSPEDLRNSALLERVENCTIQVSDKYASHWETIPDIPQLMLDATNSVLDGARQLSKNIQSLNDIDAHLIAHPEDDDFIYDLYVRSGYLQVWQIEMRKNPWQYDIRLMHKEARTGGVESYCRSVLQTEAGVSRYEINLAGYTSYAKQFGLRTFHLKKELYETLDNLHRTRVSVAEQWLRTNHPKKNELLEDEEFIEPHTPAWFSALAASNPKQASITRTLIKLAGRSDICSVCGDEPARDFRLLGGRSRGADCFRLCDDCLTIRRDQGEQLTEIKH